MHRSLARALTGFALVGLAAAAPGCGPSPSAAARGDDDASREATGSGGERGAATGDAPGDAGSAGASSAAGGGAGDDMSALLVDMVTPHLCEQLRGSFVGLPGEGGHTGPAAGTDPSVGRWWIRTCEARVDGERLSLSIAGTGWTWIDRESMGFAVRQYLRFDADAAFSARMEVGYDRARRIVTVWMRPEGEVSAHIAARGLVEAQATSVLSGMLGGLLAVTGSSANDRARAQVAEEGSAQLRSRFSAGFTVTYAVDTQQMDFMVGALDRGAVPERPYPPEDGVVWAVNARTRVWPGGTDVVGPLDADGRHALDLELEEGEAVLVDAVCAADFERFYDLLLQGAEASPPTGTRTLELASRGARRALVPALGCPTLLLITPRAGATMPIRARLRVTGADAPTATRAASASEGPATASSASGATTRAASPPSTSATAPSASATAPSAHPIAVRMTGLTLATTAPSGSRWDMLGGEPDGLVVVAFVPGRRVIEQFLTAPDQHELALDHTLPGAFHAEDLPLRFTVYDDDPMTDELVGVAELTAAQASAGGAVTLELRTTESVPVVTGSLRLAVSAVD